MPVGLLTPGAGFTLHMPQTTERSDRLAVARVPLSKLGSTTATEMAHNHPGYDIESPDERHAPHFIEVRSQRKGATTVHISEELDPHGAQQARPVHPWLVQVQQDDTTEVRYLRHLQGSPRLYFSVAGVDFEWTELWNRTSTPT